VACRYLNPEFSFRSTTSCDVKPYNPEFTDVSEESTTSIFKFKISQTSGRDNAARFLAYSSILKMEALVPPKRQ
jgi:hypothetical protein